MTSDTQNDGLYVLINTYYTVSYNNDTYFFGVCLESGNSQSPNLRNLAEMPVKALTGSRHPIDGITKIWMIISFGLMGLYTPWDDENSAG